MHQESIPSGKTARRLKALRHSVAAVTSLASIAWFSSAASAVVTPYYFDVNGATAGSGAIGTTSDWDTGTSNWNLASTGIGSTTTYVSSTNSTAVFAAGTDATTYSVNVVGTIITGGISVNSGALTLTGSTTPVLQIGSTGVQINTGVTGTTTFDSTLGTIQMVANNTWINKSSQAFVVNAAISGDGVSNRTLTLGGTGAGSGLTSFNGAISDNGSGIVSITLSNGAGGTYALNGGNSYSGGTTLTSGTLSVGSSTAFGNSTGSVAANGASISASTSLTSGTGGAIANAFVLGGSNANLFNGSNSLEISGTVTNFGGNHTITNNMSGGNLTLSGSIYLSNDNTTASRALTFGGSGVTTISGVLANNNAGNTLAANLVYNGTGGLVLSNAANTYTGTTSISGGGYVEFMSLGAIGGSGATITANASSAGAAGYAIDQTFVNRFVTTSAGVIALGANSSNNLTLASFTVATLSLGSIGNYTYSGTLTPESTTYLFGGGGGTLTVATNIAASTNKLSTVNGSSVVLTGTNLYTGSTGSGTNATLQISDSATYSGNTNVATILGPNSIYAPGNGSILQLRANGANDATAQTLTYLNTISSSLSGATFTVDVDRQGGTGTGKTLAFGGVGLVTGETVNVTGNHGYSLAIGNFGPGGGTASGTVTFNPTTANLTIASIGGGTNSANPNVDLDGLGSTNVVTGVISSNTITNTSITKSNTSAWTLSGANTFTGNTSVIGGTLKTTTNTGLGFGGKTSTAVGTTAISNNATVDLSGNLTVNEPIALNGGNLINSNAGATTLLDSGVAGIQITNGGSGLSATTPTITVAGGATATASLGITANSFTISNGGTGFVTGDIVAITGAGGATSQITVTATAGAITGFTVTNPGNGFTAAPSGIAKITGSGTGATITGNATNFQIGSIAMTNAGTGYTTAPTVTSSAGGSFAATAVLSSLSLTGTANTIGGAGNLTIAPAITGDGGGFTKVGAGTVSVAGASTYSGGTSVSQGTLKVSGALGTGDVGVADSATLELDVNTTIADTATLTLSSAANLNLAFSTGNEIVSQLIVNGNSIAAGTYFSGSSFGGYTGTFSTSGGGLQVLPEPASFSLIGLLAGGVLARRRRRQA